MKLLSTLVGLVNGYANPQTCTGVCTNAHDPSIIRRTTAHTGTSDSRRAPRIIILYCILGISRFIEKF
ncbi:hypothetical protein PR003_g26779 [Phytophthora rubi]|uniref:Uncharacterized protein n=1 Tax=Phytophthora rubi TaxID=129364 RepID=A0A6A3I868_9STRA|nr:hypothetical protein PR002_g25683 [Phytophthora rubi]KAE8976203.1 hypothetical protein PR001_g25483 [Phytophthora rubi]KAE9284729.1 hypothetical protein PR003_g26779 [Phytophthora rubi]